MSSNSLRRIAIAVVVSTCAVTASASTVNYSGNVLDRYSTTAGDDFAIVGTFPPGQSPSTLIHRYGDADQNYGADVYSEAVRDDVFEPIGSGTIVTSTGVSTGTFNGTGTAVGIDGRQIYLWVFDQAKSAQSLSFAWITGSGPTWQVTNGGSTTIDASTADNYIDGTRGFNGTVNLFFGPVPEPASVSLIAGSFGLLSLRTRSRRITVCAA